MINPTGLLFLLVYLALVAVVLWALVDAAVRPSGAFVATGKQTKTTWLVILGIAAFVVVVLGRGPLGLLGIVAAVAAGVYLADVRPAVRGTRPGGPWN